MSGLAALSEAYEAAQRRAAEAERQVAELQDLLCAFFRERDEGAGEWLRAMAEMHAGEYATRKLRNASDEGMH
jgi:hypothetical protein